MASGTSRTPYGVANHLCNSMAELGYGGADVFDAARDVLKMAMDDAKSDIYGDDPRNEWLRFLKKVKQEMERMDSKYTGHT